MPNWAPRSDDAPRRADHRRTLDRARRLRKDLNESERALWKLLRALKADGVHFRKQANVGPYVFDFAALSHKLLIELDGGIHNAPDVALRDAAKQEWAEAQGYRVMRLMNAEVAKEPQRVVARVRQFLNAPRPPAPSPEGEGE